MKSTTPHGSLVPEVLGIVILVNLAAVSGCTGQITGVPSGAEPDPGGHGADQGMGAVSGTGGHGGNTVGPIPVSFECNTAAPATTPTPMRRLSSVQYKNTLAALFAGVAGLGVFDPLQIAGAGLLNLPPDTLAAGFSGMDARLTDRHAQTFYDVADALAGAVTKDPAKLLALGTACANQAAPTAACVDAFLDGFAMRAYRRPLVAEERTRYQAINDGTRDGRELFRSLVFLLLMSPQFLDQVELEGAALDGSATTFTLGPYELASRLSYHFWQSMPDDELFRAARDGSILTGAGYAAQVDRMFADARTRKTVETFYAEWFALGSIPDFIPGAAFTSLVAGSPIESPAARTEFLKAAADEITALTNHYTWDAAGTFKDLLVTDLSFTASPSLAGIYGVKAWDGGAEQPHLAVGERAGLLTRASFLISGKHSTSPIHRGKIVRTQILCNVLPPPPSPADFPAGTFVAPVPDATLTTRQVNENKVVNQPCAACHAQMNPIGYVLESYDAVGRHRTTERIFDDTGTEINTLPINSTAVPRINEDDGTSVGNGLELSRKIADSGQTEACFAREYFKFAFHRDEAADDGCALEGVRKALADGNLQDALHAIALTPGFQTRRAQ